MGGLFLLDDPLARIAARDHAVAGAELEDDIVVVVGALHA
jgi:hypothetical protein